MSNEASILTADQREILGISWHDGAGISCEVGVSGVTQIICYDERGQFGPVPWIAVYHNDAVWQRASADRAHIYYTEGPNHMLGGMQMPNEPARPDPTRPNPGPQGDPGPDQATREQTPFDR